MLRTVEPWVRVRLTGLVPTSKLRVPETVSFSLANEPSVTADAVPGVVSVSVLVAEMAWPLLEVAVSPRPSVLARPVSPRAVSAVTAAARLASVSPFTANVVPVNVPAPEPEAAPEPMTKVCVTATPLTVLVMAMCPASTSLVLTDPLEPKVMLEGVPATTACPATVVALFSAYASARFPVTVMSLPSVPDCR